MSNMLNKHVKWIKSLKQNTCPINQFLILSPKNQVQSIFLLTKGSPHHRQRNIKVGVLDLMPQFGFHCRNFNRSATAHKIYLNHETQI